MNQRIEILKHLQTEGSITPAQALRKFGCYRLAARIQELRKDGWSIETRTVKRPNRRGYAKYEFVKLAI